MDRYPGYELSYEEVASGCFGFLMLCLDVLLGLFIFAACVAAL